MGVIFAIEIIIILFNVILICKFAKNKKEDVFENCFEKTVEIRCGNDDSWSYATGCFVDDLGTVLTNKHVVENSLTNELYEKIYIRLITSSDYIQVSVKSISEDYDLALLETGIKGCKYFNISTDYYVGENIYTIGNPNNYGLSLSMGTISANLKNVLYKDKNILAMQVDLNINEGNSGGPIFNSQGDLLALVSFRLRDSRGDVVQGIGFCVPARCINNYINI